MNILSLRVITSMFQVWVLKQKAAIDGIIVINCGYGHNKYFFVLTSIFYSLSLYVITDNVANLHLVHMFACYLKEDFEFCMLTFQF